MNPTVVFVPPEGICLQCVIAVFLPHMPRDTIHKPVKVETQCNQLLSDGGSSLSCHGLKELCLGQ